MKRNILLILTLAVGFIFTACGGGGNTRETVTEPIYGSITFQNLPAGYSVVSCLVNSNPTSTWVYKYGSIEPSSDTNWNSSTIGCGGSATATDKISIIGKTSDTYYGSDFTFTGNGSVWAQFDDPDPGYINRGYNNVHFSNGHAIIDYAAIVFALPQTDGAFKLTNAADYDNKYVILVGVLSNATTILYGFGNADSATALKGFKIQGGEVTLPVYSLNTGDTHFSSYFGNDKPTFLYLIIMDNENFDYLDYTAHSANYKYLLYSTTNYPSPNAVTFSGGKVTADAANGTKFPTSDW